MSATPEDVDYGNALERYEDKFGPAPRWAVMEFDAKLFWDALKSGKRLEGDADHAPPGARA